MSGAGSLSERMAAIRDERMAVATFDWGRVTLGDFAALDVLRSGRAVQLLNRAWDECYSSGRQVWPSEPVRLTAAGVRQVDAWAATAAAGNDAAAVLAARAFASLVGALSVRDAARLLGSAVFA